MVESEKPTEPTQVQCEVCLKEVPKSEAESAEVHEYVMYFCGLECYGQWHKVQEEQEVEGGSPPPGE